MKLLLIIMLPCLSSASAATEYDYLIMHGERYQNACNTDRIKELRENIYRSEALDKELAFSTVEKILCFPLSEIDTTFLLKLVPKHVEETIEGTGEVSTIRKKRRSDDLINQVFANRNAWNAHLRIDGKIISLQYFTNEACVKSATLIHKKSGWFISSIGEACD